MDIRRPTSNDGFSGRACLTLTIDTLVRGGMILTHNGNRDAPVQMLKEKDILKIYYTTRNDGGTYEATGF